MKNDEYIIFKIRDISNLIKRKIEEVINKSYEEDFTSRHIMIARYLHRNSDKDIFQKDIEEEFCIRRSTVTSILNVMEKKGMIKRVRVDYDARLNKIVLTDKIIKMQNSICNKVLDMEDAILKDLTEEEIKTLTKILDKIKQNIS